MKGLPRLRDLNPLRTFDNGRFSYQRLPNPSPTESQQYQSHAATKSQRWRNPLVRLSFTKLITLAITSIIILAFLGGRGYHQVRKQKGEDKPVDSPSLFYWQYYWRLDGYYNGVRTLVSPAQYEPENRFNRTIPPTHIGNPEMAKFSPEPPLDPVRYDPYPDWKSAEYLKDHEQMHPCYLDAEEKVSPPDTYAYPGVPQHMAQPLYGSYKELGIEENVCFERFGRLGPYGYGYNESEGGLGIVNRSENAGSEKVSRQSGYTDYTSMDWGSAQKRCYDKNKARFDVQQTGRKKRVERHAYVMRTWTGYEYNEYQMLSLRAMITELSLKSGGEYDVHFLVHVKNNSIPIWASPRIYQETLQNNVPREFWNISTLWSEQQMETYYLEPFPDNFANMAGSSIHGVYRSAHFPLQWFSQQHPHYDFVWNWEMDMRNTGHYWEFHSRVSDWAQNQPRKGLWERSARFWIPEHHGSYANFTNLVERETCDRDIAANDLAQNGPVPLWGPYQDFPHSGMLAPPNDTIPPTSYEADSYTWGVGEHADLIVFNPLFDPARTNWVFSWDVTGYNRSLPIPPRRAAIITVARLSKRLLGIMHEETWRMKHSMFPEMWPAALSMHHGLKAVYAPHPVYFDRDWEAGHADEVFNHPEEVWESPFGWGEHNLLGSSFYYNSGFSGALWRRWLGQRENGEGGRREEEGRSGRMCLRGTLLHPVKSENGPED
ncbi:hypothetical protein LTR91_022277 [Friedmanniomyces endolithicus]|uniref:Major facilitator superfamily transporter n=1 Tax=Friedmanniomyces endolithicus TaxID=329885 RepID=A0AAN6H8V5_9PEZI|nr:hypothetical protein LTR57_021307 [Friedmanniomyces endolithicus]KAK0956621.1 hypothetical protein LTR91_022277 [Friedmanniomyces endolithicus]KAK0992832.1 hypothetical protein LTS01_007610 [Friedmanniomyces endolithicus]KAK1042181.1 hypothetical protein LTS16_008968 [Friedmanniomyces endolithicus]